MKNSEPRPLAPPLLVLMVGLLAASTSSIFIRYAQQSAPSLVIAAWRLSLATILLAPYALLRHRTELAGMSRKQWVLAAISGVFLALHFATWISSLAYTTVTSSVVLVGTTPLWVALISTLVFKERLPRAGAIGLAIALVGGLVVGLSDTCRWQAGVFSCPSLAEFTGGQAFLGDVLAWLGAVLAAGYLIIGRRMRTGLSLISYIFVVYGVAALTLLLLVAARSLPLFGYPAQTYLWFLALAVVPQLLGHSSYNWALKYLSTAYVSVSLLGEPIWSSTLAYFLLGEIPGGLKIAGAVLILAGIYITARGGN